MSRMSKTRAEMLKEQGMGNGGSGGNPHADIEVPSAIIAPSPPMGNASPHLPGHLDPAKDAKVPGPRRFRVVDVPRGADGSLGSISMGRFKTRLLPGKILDERYFDIRAVKMQGAKLEEIFDNGIQDDNSY